MKLLWMILCSFSFLLSDGMSQKLIIYTDKNRKNAQENLLKLKVYFIENQNIKTLIEANNLQLELETLGTYTMVVLKPIVSLSVKNRLLMELAPVFPDVFTLEDKNQHKTNNHSQINISIKDDALKKNKVRGFIDTIGLQWIILLLLAMLGLSLSILRRKKLHILDAKQKALDTDQKMIENEIKNLGKNNV